MGKRRRAAAAAAASQVPDPVPVADIGRAADSGGTGTHGGVAESQGESSLASAGGSSHPLPPPLPQHPVDTHP